MAAGIAGLIEIVARRSNYDKWDKPEKSKACQQEKFLPAAAVDAAAGS